MGIESIISCLLYLFTFCVGFILDVRTKSDKTKRWYVVWMFIFLCFGYMTGSDWRNYEWDYNYASRQNRAVSEFGFYLIFDMAKRLNIDFWLFSGIMKSLYLFAVIRLLKKLTPYYTSCLSICMVGSLLFMLVDYPMRFTVACTIFLFAVPYLFKHKILQFLLISSFGIIFHNTIAVTILFFLIGYYCSDKLIRTNKYFLSILYIAFAFVFSSISNVAIIQNLVTAFYVDNGVRDFSQNYLVEDNDAFWTIGSFIQIFLSCFVIFVKDYFVGGNWKQILKLSIVGSFFSRILLIVPSGFRLTIPLGIFSSIIIVSYFYKCRHWLSYVVIALYFLMLSKSLYFSYVYIPYSNSIPYIITQKHLPYNERSQYNLTEFIKRTGHSFYQNAE